MRFFPCKARTIWGGVARWGNEARAVWQVSEHIFGIAEVSKLLSDAVATNWRVAFEQIGAIKGTRAKV